MEQGRITVHASPRSPFARPEPDDAVGIARRCAEERDRLHFVASAAFAAQLEAVRPATPAIVPPAAFAPAERSPATAAAGLAPLRLACVYGYALWQWLWRQAADWLEVLVRRQSPVATTSPFSLSASAASHCAAHVESGGGRRRARRRAGHMRRESGRPFQAEELIVRPCAAPPMGYP